MDTSRFRYTFQKGLRSAIRTSKIVLETFRLNLIEVHCFVMGDDDMVFFPENLLQMLSKSMTLVSTTTLEPIQKVPSRMFCILIAWLLEAGLSY